MRFFTCAHPGCKRSVLKKEIACCLHRRGILYARKRRELERLLRRIPHTVEETPDATVFRWNRGEVKLWKMQN